MERNGLRHKPIQRRGEEQLQNLVSAAAAVIAEHGVEKLTTSLVAKEAGVSVGLVYRYFADRDALLRAVLLRSLDGHDEILWKNGFNIAGPDWRAQVALGVDLSASFVRDRTLGFRALWFSDVLTGAMVEANRRHDTSLALTLAGQLSSAQRRKMTADPEAVMMMYLAIWDKGLDVAFRRDPEGDETLLEEAKKACLRYLEPYLGQRVT